MLLKTDVTFRISIHPVQTTGTDVHAVESRLLRMAFLFCSIKHGTSTFSAKAPQYALRGSIPRDIAFPLFEFEPVQWYGRPGYESGSMRSSTALAVAMSEKIGGKGNLKFDFPTKTPTGSKLILHCDLLGIGRIPWHLCEVGPPLQPTSVLLSVGRLEDAGHELVEPGGSVAVAGVDLQ